MGHAMRSYTSVCHTTSNLPSSMMPAHHWVSMTPTSIHDYRFVIGEGPDTLADVCLLLRSWARSAPTHITPRACPHVGMLSAPLTMLSDGRMHACTSDTSHRSLARVHASFRRWAAHLVSATRCNLRAG